ncbi:hypothetical protein TELCIR_11099 [Teladorsagia circumcincta]|uniref:Uncharacterized protein n=1 Tax=Teladorsagia circumcincta TaxID=45464 RepID=A0A2G9UAD5_TELCI|nr:hypothetical protein TELCIR_11099 [Teladorsagia circumcincta]
MASTMRWLMLACLLVMCFVNAYGLKRRAKLLLFSEKTLKRIHFRLALPDRMNDSTIKSSSKNNTTKLS